VSAVGLCLALALSAVLSLFVAAVLGCASDTERMSYRTNSETRARLYRGAWAAFGASILLAAASVWVAAAAGLIA
jgi:hypothetical protein